MTTATTGIMTVSLEKLLNLHSVAGRLADLSNEVDGFNCTIAIQEAADDAAGESGLTSEEASAIEVLIESAGHNMAEEDVFFWSDERIAELGDLLRAVRDGNRADLENM